MQDEKLNNNQNVMTDKNGRYIIKSSLERQSEFGKTKSLWMKQLNQRKL